MNGHQVIGLPPGVREAPLEEFIKRFQLVQPPVLSGADFAEITTQIHEALIPFVRPILVPSEDLVDLRATSRFS
jgi:hypothetical protein